MGVHRPKEVPGIFLGFCCELVFFLVKGQTSFIHRRRRMLLKFGTVELDLDRFELRNCGKISAIEPKAFDLLVYLLENRPRVISKDEIYEKIWDGRIISEATLTSCVNAARKAIGDNGRRQQLIRTVPRRGYSFIAEVALIDKDRTGLGSSARSSIGSGRNVSNEFGPPNAIDKMKNASIVILPFDSTSPDELGAALADGVTEDITTALTRLRRLFVIARSTAAIYKSEVKEVNAIARELGVSYVLEGSIRKQENKIRVTAKLTEASSGIHVWAERYDRALDDIFDVQDEIAQAIVQRIEPEILARERLKFGVRRPDNLSAWELLQKGQWHFYQQNERSHGEAIDLFRQAVELEPSYPQAQAHLAFALWTMATLRPSHDPKRLLQEARQTAETAMSLDPDEPLSRFVSGRLCLLDGQVDLAVAHMQAAIATAPNYAGGHYGLGLALYLGKADAEQALAHFDYAVRLNPRNPMIWATYEKQCCAHRFLGQFDEAIIAGMRARSFSNDSFRPHLYLSAALAAGGRLADSKSELRKAHQIRSDLSISFLKQQFSSQHSDVLDNFLGWLRKAGLE